MRGLFIDTGIKCLSSVNARASHDRPNVTELPVVEHVAVASQLSVPGLLESHSARFAAVCSGSGQYSLTRETYRIPGIRWLN